MNDGHSSIWIAGLVLVVLAAVGIASTLGFITDRQATIEQAQAQIAQAQAQAAIETTRAIQEAKTERMQSFYATLAALTSRPDDRLFIILILILLPVDVIAGIYAIRKRAP